MTLLARNTACLILLSATLLATGGAARDATALVALTGGDELPPRIRTPGPGKAPARRMRGATTTAPRLPSGMRGWLPAHDGDAVMITLRPTATESLTAEEVRDAVIAPILKAIGFSRGLGALRLPPAGAVELPRPAFAPLAQAAALEYAAHPALKRPKTQAMLEVFLDPRAASAEIDRALLLAEGMTFTQLRNGIERRELVFPFVQVHDDERHRAVPIEHAALFATAWEGESVRSVRGALVDDYVIMNSVALDAARASAALSRRILALPGLTRVVPVAGAAQLVLVPVDRNAAGQVRLAYAYRTQVEAVWQGRLVRFLVWADAGRERLLRLEPMLGTAMAAGRTFNRDPGVSGELTVAFEVDGLQTDPLDGQSKFTLSRSKDQVGTRLDYRSDGYDVSDVAILPGVNGSTTTFANFAGAAFSDPAGALCAGPTPAAHAANRYFQQVSLFATLMRHRETIVAGGIFQDFPHFIWNPMVEFSTWGCNADRTMAFGVCEGYRHPQCPNAPNLLMNFAHDNTIVAHELGHEATSRLTNDRPLDWCAPRAGQTCPMPFGWLPFHDLADFWGAHLESSNCLGGWVGKNMGGANASLYCRGTHHSEGGGFPRKLELRAGSTLYDHFPEHREGPGRTSDYADGQIPSAALWEVRAGMRSKSPVAGVPQFGVRVQRALTHAGFFGVFEPRDSALDRYRQLLDFLVALVEQWATVGSSTGAPAFTHDGAHTTSKVTAGFARAGLFLVPWQCLDADPSNDAALGCSAAAPGADAVIDVDDHDTTDDVVVNGVTVVDRDYLTLGGPVPIFHVWTGPRYRMDGMGSQSYPNPAPCNAMFQVEVTTDPTFATITATSPWLPVNRDPSRRAAQCYGTWSPTAKWPALQAGGTGSPVYYRARTRDAAGGTERISTRPGNGLWTVPPPYAIITLDGRSEY